MSRIPAAARGLDPVPAARALDHVVRKDREGERERRRRRREEEPGAADQAPRGPVRRDADGRPRVDVQA
jgi:hypothetical protein